MNKTQDYRITVVPVENGGGRRTGQAHRDERGPSRPCLPNRNRDGILRLGSVVRPDLEEDGSEGARDVLCRVEDSNEDRNHADDERDEHGRHRRHRLAGLITPRGAPAGFSPLDGAGAQSEVVFGGVWSPCGATLPRVRTRARVT